MNGSITSPLVELDVCLECGELFLDELDECARICPGCQMIGDLERGLEEDPYQEKAEA